jgi:hypothetical protein
MQMVWSLSDCRKDDAGDIPPSRSKGKELQALVHGNRLFNAYTGNLEALEKMWVSPSMKDALRRINVRSDPELVPSSVKNTHELESYLMDTEDLDLSDEVPLPDTPLPPPTVQLRKPAKGMATINKRKQSAQRKVLPSE